MTDQVSIPGTLGALEIGLLIGTFLFGILTAQTLVYYERFPEDPLRIKSLVAATWILGFIHSITTSCFVYTLCIVYYGRSEDGKIFTSLYVTFLVGAALVFIVQAFFSYRIYKIMDRSILGIVCFLLSFTRFITVVVLAVGIFRQPTFTEVERHYSQSLTIVMVGSAGIDVVIAVSLCCFFIIRRNTYMHKTTRILDSLILLSLQTGLITSITATSMMITFKTMPKYYIWIGIYVFLGKLYSNSLLASLNNRKQLRVDMNTGITMPGFRISTSADADTDGRVPPVITIDVTTSLHTCAETATIDGHHRKPEHGSTVN